MSEIGKRIFYELDSGYPIITVPEMRGVFNPRTAEEDIQLYPILRDRDRQSFGVIELEYGQYERDFYDSNSNYQVNTETKELEFTYPDPSDPEAPPVFGKPLTEQIAELEAQNMELMLAVAELADANETDKLETQLAVAELAATNEINKMETQLAIAELANIVMGGE